MKRAIIIIVIVGMFGWAVYDFVFKADSSTLPDESSTEVEEDMESTTSDTDEEDKEGLEAGNIAPDFELTTLDGEVVKLSDFRGQRVLLNFWATWCPPCRAEMPDMQKFHENKDVVILAVDLYETETDKDNIPSFVEEFGLTFQVLLDEKTEVANLYQIQPIPTSFLIDSNGRIQNKALGALNYELMVQGFEMME